MVSMLDGGQIFTPLSFFAFIDKAKDKQRETDPRSSPPPNFGFYFEIAQHYGLLLSTASSYILLIHLQTETPSQY